MKIVNVYISILQFRRALQILGILTKHSLGELFSHTRFSRRRRRKVQKTVHTTPERIRMTIEDLGPTFVKFGQILADRPDMVSEKFRIELKKLQSRALPFDNDYALSLIEKELGAPIDEIFSEFNTTPLAAASIGQVYEGRLRSGDEVIVKIRRPYIENKIKLDIYLLKHLARSFAKRYPELAAVNIVGLIDEFSTTILKELDYTLEASNIYRFQTMFKDDRAYSVGIQPILHEKTARDGTYPGHRSRRSARAAGGRARHAPDRRQRSRHAADDDSEARILPRRPARRQHLHHAGQRNRDDRFRHGRRADAARLELPVGFRYRLRRRNGDTISKALITLCGKKFFEREEELRFEIHQMMMQYTGVPIETVNFAGAMQACIDVIVKYQLQIPSGIFMLIKALATLEKFAATLDPQLSLAPIILPYAKQIVKEKYAPRKIAGMLYDTLSSYVGFIRSFPDDASEILYKLKEGKIKHDIRLDDNALFVRTIKSISRRIAYVIVLVGLFIGSALLMVFDKGNAYGRFILIAASVLILLKMLKWLFSDRNK